MSQPARCLLLLAVVAVCQPACAEDKPLRVMSFNIRLGVAKDGDNHWDKRRDLVIETIRKYEPDLLGTQETWHFQADFLKSKLPKYAYVGWTRQAGKEGEQCGVLYRRDRFELVDSGQFWLSETPEVKGSKSWDSSLPRIATWIEVKDKSAGNKVVKFINTHFDHRGPVARLEAAKLLREVTQKEIKTKDRAIVMTGDFNCSDVSKPYKALVEGKDLIDTWRVTHPGRNKGEGTFNGFKGNRMGPRIDWVLHNKHFKTKASGIDHTSKNGQFPSDHFPVTATLNWR